MMVRDPSSIRFEARKDPEGGVVINGHRFASPEELKILGEEIIDRRVTQTVEAIRRGGP